MPRRYIQPIRSNGRHLSRPRFRVMDALGRDVVSTGAGARHARARSQVYAGCASLPARASTLLWRHFGTARFRVATSPAASAIEGGTAALAAWSARLVLTPEETFEARGT